MNAKTIGQAVRRGILAGALTGFVAGWGAFALGARPHASTASAARTDTGIATAVARQIPPFPKAPTLAAMPTPIAVATMTAVKADLPPAIPTLQPLPPLPNVQVSVHTTTRTS
jgi:hypothetical protein